MAFLSPITKQVVVKIVYYGPGLSGKTTNFKHIYRFTDDRLRGELICLETEANRTFFFDLLPLKMGEIERFKIHFHLYTIAGQVLYEAGRKSVLKGADGIVFVADSQIPLLDANIESFNMLREYLLEYQVDLDQLPLVFQYNKRDLRDIIPVETLNSLLNTKNCPYIEASAIRGQGVFETLNEVARLILAALKVKLKEERDITEEKITLQKVQIKRALVKHEEKLKEEVRFSEKKRDGREKIKVRRIRLDSFSEITRELDLLSRTYIGKPILHKRKYYQRKYIYTTLKKEISRAQRNRERIVVLMLGIDEFEKINDEYGNKYGEFVVKKVFKIIKSTLRPYDVIARYENNEFIILLINTNNKSCVQIINRIQKAVEKPTITLNSISWNASVSAGICFCPWKKKFKGDYKELIQLADEALHEAKQKGRSRILIHPLSR